MKRIGIVGTRSRDSFEDFILVVEALEKVYEDGDVLVSGGCKLGADRFADYISKQKNIPIITHYPDEKHLTEAELKSVRILREKKLFRAAAAIINYARNKLIALDSDTLIACVSPERTGGTENTIKRFRAFHPKGEIILV